MARPLTGAVGRNGYNRKKDVVRVQAMLNVMPVQSGGPAIPLKLDDMIGPKTMAAIDAFQMKQFGKKDATIDREGPTWRKLVEIENGNNRAMLLAPASENIAKGWTEAGLWHINQALDGDTMKPQEEVPFKVRDMLSQYFGLQYDPLPTFSALRRQLTVDDLTFIRDKLAAMKECLSQPSMYAHVDVMQMYNDLTQPRRLQMCGATRLGPMVNFSFCEPDSVNQIGAADNFRASVMLQSSAFAGDDKDRSYGVNNMSWLVSGMASATFTLHYSGSFLAFCQKAASLSSYYYIQDDNGTFYPATLAMPS